MCKILYGDVDTNEGILTEANVMEATSTLGAEGPTMLSVGHFSRSFIVIYVGLFLCHAVVI